MDPSSALPQPRADVETAARLHLAAERAHDRRALMQFRRNGAWDEMPDWRFDRQVIRLALFLRERAGLHRGDLVAAVSPLRPELVVLDWAAAVQGAAVVLIDPSLPAAAFGAVLVQTAPKAVFLAGPDRLSEVRGSASAPAIILFDGPVPEGAQAWSQVLDLGGTLDTAERAQALRAQAREVTPDAPGLAHVERGADGEPRSTFLRQCDLAARLRAAWSADPPRKGKLAYVEGGAPSLETRLALHAFVADGLTCAALGTPGREAEEIAELRPDRILGPSATASAPPRVERPPRARSRLGAVLSKLTWNRGGPA